MQAKLATFKSKAKAQTKVTEVKYDWMRERLDLTENSNKTTKVIHASLKATIGLLGNDPADGDTFNSISIMSEVNELKTSMASDDAWRESVEEYKSRLGELKGVLDVLKASSGGGESGSSGTVTTNDHGDDGSSGSSSSTSREKAQASIKPLFAEMLLRSREALGNDLASLNEEYAQAAKEAKEARAAVFKSLREGNRDNTDVPEQVLDAIKSSGFEDNVEMELFREDMLVKFGECRQEFDALKQALGVTDAASGTSGELYAKFIKVTQQWESKSKAGGVKKLMERLAMQIPDTQPAVFQSMLSQYNEQKMARQKSEDAKANYSRKKEALVQWALKGIEATKQSLIKRAEQDYINGISSLMRQEQHERLETLRAARELKQKEDDEKREEIRQIRERWEREAKEAWDAEHAASKAEVEKYKEKLRQEDEARKLMKKMQEDEEEKERVSRMEVNEERVVYRGVVIQEKIRAAQYEIELKAIREREKVDRLSALAATVPYWDKVLAAEADLSKTTKARENDVYCEDLSGLYSFQQGDGKLRSFTNEKVFSDVRFRLGAALHAAGVSHTAASGAMIRQLIPRAPERTTGIGMRYPAQQM
jgi:hypothetical protein